MLPQSAPLVSVIIPCYTQAHLLADSIESALAQTYRRTELVVVDDGSSDNTAELAAEII
jgi:glycosyltransferase involved in cell wall biosynthesis